MSPLGPDFLLELLLLLPPLLLSLTVHEFAHARTALAFGDPTAKMLGRVSLNPLRHLDPVGTLVLIFTRMIGWAKPVPVNPHNLHPRGLGEVMVSLAGPMSNLLLAVTAALIMRLLLAFPSLEQYEFMPSVYLVLAMLLAINLALCVFNMLPLFPLDGHHIARELLPADRRADFMTWQIRYGRIILLAIIFLPALLSRLLQAYVPSPIGFLHGQLLDQIIRLFGIGRAILLARL